MAFSGCITGVWTLTVLMLNSNNTVTIMESLELEEHFSAAGRPRSERRNLLYYTLQELCTQIAELRNLRCSVTEPSSGASDRPTAEMVKDLVEKSQYISKTEQVINTTTPEALSDALDGARKAQAYLSCVIESQQVQRGTNAQKWTQDSCQERPLPIRRPKVVRARKSSRPQSLSIGCQRMALASSRRRYGAFAMPPLQSHRRDYGANNGQVLRMSPPTRVASRDLIDDSGHHQFDRDLVHVNQLHNPRNRSCEGQSTSESAAAEAEHETHEMNPESEESGWNPDFSEAEDEL